MTRSYTMTEAALEVRRKGGRAMVGRHGEENNGSNHGRWARAWDACQRCARTDRPHRGRGLCSACHSADWREARVASDEHSDEGVEGVVVQG